MIEFGEDSPSLLRIIATDAACLQHPYRDDLRRVADELELAQRTVSTIYAQLLETKQQLVAAQQRLKDANIPSSFVFPFVSLGAATTGRIAQ